MEGGDAAATLRSSIGPGNLPLVSAFLACAIAQFLKPFTTWIKDKKWDSRRMIGSGGMPSSHSATVTALATAIGLQEGAWASSFAIAVVLACVTGWCQLRKISSLVQDLCKKHNLPYVSLSFFEANRYTLKTLGTAAMGSS